MIWNRNLLKRMDTIYDYADVLISLAEERYFEPIYEVKKNDSLVGILLSPPYQLDITPYMKEGNNKMEILVYSTLANHYQTIPTPLSRRS